MFAGNTAMCFTSCAAAPAQRALQKCRCANHCLKNRHCDNEPTPQLVSTKILPRHNGSCDLSQHFKRQRYCCHHACNMKKPKETYAHAGTGPGLTKANFIPLEQKSVPGNFLHLPSRNGSRRAHNKNSCARTANKTNPAQRL